MEWWGIAASLAWTGLVGYLLGVALRPNPRGEQLELADMYEKLRHLYDRTRKRTEKDTADMAQALDGDAELRARAIQKGLLSGVHRERPHS